eukprot:CAMPEP_0205853058 /NCGR_PEP_ID=MMETSP1083-20121108/1347_1 /ASSEMBLY_ACC=CAM_ASM_000430 /TAXON_ID=97485 /ORGANISM="Prymnesium parvum, Strain Texoma1" /LENGTH=42 /DNA_ID= /DNA_START= /DNA_END= /DNA_ORIENTATION=
MDAPMCLKSRLLERGPSIGSDGFVLRGLALHGLAHHGLALLG